MPGRSPAFGEAGMGYVNPDVCGEAECGISTGGEVASESDAYDV